MPAASSAPAPAAAAAAPPARAAARASAAAPSTDGLPTRDDITLAWGDELLAKIPRAAKARYTAGRFVEVGDRGAVFAVPNATHMSKCEEYRAQVEAVLAEHFGRPVPLVLVVEGSRDPGEAQPAAPPAAPARSEPAPEPIEEIDDVHELADAPPDKRTSVDQLTEAFPGAELLPEGDGD